MSEISFDTGIQISSRRLTRSHSSTTKWLQILLDQVAVILVLWVHVQLRTGGFGQQYAELSVATILLMALFYNGLGIYSRRKSPLAHGWSLIKGWAAVMMALIVIGFVTKTSQDYSREVILTWALTGILVQLIAYQLVLFVQSHIVKDDVPTLVIGGGALGKHLVKHINANSWLPDKIVGVIESSSQLKRQWTNEDVPILGALDDLADIIAAKGIKRLYIALPMQQAQMIKPIYLKLVDKNIDIIWAPDIFGVNLLNHSVREVAGVPLICLSETPLIGSNAFMKSMFDKCAAGVAIIIASPIMIVAALAVKLTSKGPVFFKQQRHGFDGQVINVLKFRSMRVHEEEDGHITQATKGDSRITPVGAFIRKTSIDELPQLFNVLAGSMSLVGPRPHALAHNHLYSEKIEAYMTRHRIKPGLTGLAQVNGFRGETDTLEKMAARVQYDLAYINNWSIWLDIQIILRTVFVLFGKNVY